MIDELYNTLNKPKWTKIRIATKQAQIKDLRLMMLPSGIRYDKDSVQSSPKDPMLQFIEKLSDLEEELHKLEKDYTRQYTDVEKLVKTLDDPRLEEIITLRYLVCYEPKEIAAAMGYAESWVHKLHRDAIKELEGCFEFQENKWVLKKDSKK